VVKAAVPLAALPQAQSFQGLLAEISKASSFGAGTSGIYNMGGVSYLPATSGTTSYAANSLKIN
jgi:hypothetical protein